MIENVAFKKHFQPIHHALLGFCAIATMGVRCGRRFQSVEANDSNDAIHHQKGSTPYTYPFCYTAGLVGDGGGRFDKDRHKHLLRAARNL